MIGLKLTKKKKVASWLLDAFSFTNAALQIRFNFMKKVVKNCK